MKKNVILALAVISIGIMSCNKCHECHYELVDANGAEQEVELGEHCEDDLKDIEASGYKLNDSTTVEVHCHAH